MRDNLRGRLILSFISTIVRSGISFITGMLLARWLGPSDYGRMAFLLASFLAFRQLIDMGSSSAFFTFISRRPRSQKFKIYYFRWLGLQFFVSILLVGVLLPDHLVLNIWNGEGRWVVLMALIATFMQNVVWSTASQMAEAQKETLRIQILNFLIVGLHLCAMFILWWVGILAIPLIFIALAIEWGVAGWFAAHIFFAGNFEDKAGKDLGEKDTCRSVLKEFWQYCLPFIPYAWLGFACNFLDYWMLQHWGGASQQAYYAIAAQFAAAALLVTTSILNIFWKEVSEAHYLDDNIRVGQLYVKTTRALYFVGAVIAGGLLPWTSEIIILILGPAYIGGVTTLMIMFLYPVHQSLGQIGSTILYATGHTRTQAFLGMTYMVISIFVAYFVMAPKNAIIPGLGLASVGLAYKMVILQVISINIMNWCIFRIIDKKLDWIYQLVSLGLAIIIGWIAKILLTSLLEYSVLTVMATSTFLYLLLMSCIFLIMPWIAGVSRNEINRVVFIFKEKIHAGK